MAQMNRVSGKFEFSSMGTLHSFDPNRQVYDNLNGGKKISLLEVHLDIVRQRNRKDVFVIDSRGNIVNPDGSFVPYYQPKPTAKGNTRRHR